MRSRRESIRQPRPEAESDGRRGHVACRERRLAEGGGKVRRSVAALVTALALGACASGGDELPSAALPGASSTSTPADAAAITSSTGAAPTTTVRLDVGGGAARRAADQQMAEAALLRRSDFPPGWVAEPPSPDDPSLDKYDDAFYECLGIAKPDEGPSADSDKFVGPTGVDVRNSVFVQDGVAALFAVYATPKGVACLERSFVLLAEEVLRGQELPPGMRFASLTLDRMSFPTIGDGSLALRLTISYIVRGEKIDFPNDLVMFYKGRAGVTLMASDPSGPFDPRELERYGRLIASRVPG